MLLKRLCHLDCRACYRERCQVDIVSQVFRCFDKVRVMTVIQGQKWPKDQNSLFILM